MPNEALTSMDPSPGPGRQRRGSSQQVRLLFWSMVFWSRSSAIWLTTLPAPDQPRTEEVGSLFLCHARELKTILVHELVELWDILQKMAEGQEASVSHPRISSILILVAVLAEKDRTRSDWRRARRRVLVKPNDRGVGHSVKVPEAIYDSDQRSEVSN